MKNSLNWWYLTYALVSFCGLAWAVYVIRTEVTELGDLIGMGVVGAVCLIFGVFSLVMGFFEKRIMKVMYGEFSNRNPWGM